MYRLAMLQQHPDNNHVVTQWECDFQKEQKDNEHLRAFLTTLQGPHTYMSDPLDPRDAFFGGRTNTAKLYYEAKEEDEIKYVDVCWLYPYICKYGTYPMGHPKIKDHPPISDLFELHGLIQCRVLPPTDLYHPVLPHKLLFPLCRTVPVPTVMKTEHGLTTCETDMQEGGLFAKHVNNFFKIRQEAGGYPGGCTDPDAYIREIQQKEGVTLDTHICKNPGLPALAKACLNNHWDKFGQCVGFDKAEYISSPERYFALLRDERCLVKDIHVVNEDLIHVTHEPQPEFYNPPPAHNVVIAAGVTAQARLKLYSYQKPLDRRVLYFHMDSIIYIHRPLCYNPPLGDTLGELTDERRRQQYSDLCLRRTEELRVQATPLTTRWHRGWLDLVESMVTHPLAPHWPNPVMKSCVMKLRAMKSYVIETPQLN
ncbi:uncharacterized protein [Haliotis asinina]|uniref:uncharacterized protein n=1 Tax=Haliotis asinina TaxID=109174 RepID=UPI00353270AA